MGAPNSSELVETLVIGGGQAGLAMSEQLGLRGLPHLVVERARVAERWRSERWDGLRSLGPNWATCIGSFAYAGSDPDGYMSRDEIVAFITAYATAIAAPVRCGVEVAALTARRDGEPGFQARTRQGTIEARNVVVATGPFQRPLVPSALAQGVDAFQLHASAYRNPAQLPDGAVLVVGAGPSGLQIADELLRAGRRVFLSIGRHLRLPRRYRGRDQVWWRMELGTWREPVTQRRPSQGALAVTGAHGGYTVDFRDFAARGAVLLGRAEAACDGVVRFASDLAANLAKGDAALMAFLDAADAHAAKAGLDLPHEPEARRIPPAPACVTDPIMELDLRKEGVGAVIWASGYALDFGWIGLPVLDPTGEPVHSQGVTEVPGLYFLGLNGLARRNSALFNGVGEDSAYLAEHLAGRRSGLIGPGS